MVSKEQDPFTDWNDLHRRAKKSTVSKETFRLIDSASAKWIREETDSDKYQFEDNDELLVQLRLLQGRDKNADTNCAEVFEEIQELLEMAQ